MIVAQTTVVQFHVHITPIRGDLKMKKISLILIVLPLFFIGACKKCCTPPDGHFVLNQCKCVDCCCGDECKDCPNCCCEECKDCHK